MCSADKNTFLTMEIKYYKSGLRPVYREIEKDYSIFYAFQWDTWEFKIDLDYNQKFDSIPVEMLRNFPRNSSTPM